MEREGTDGPAKRTKKGKIDGTAAGRLFFISESLESARAAAICFPSVPGPARTSSAAYSSAYCNTEGVSTESGKSFNQQREKTHLLAVLGVLLLAVLFLEVVDTSLLVLLVLCNEVLHVGLGLGEPMRQRTIQRSTISLPESHKSLTSGG